jgi:hypothetical protein
VRLSTISNVPMKMGQVVTFELAPDQAKFERLFTPD